MQIVDEFTGRILLGRRYSEGLHQAIEAKERIRIAQRNRTLATITFQNFFRMYEKLGGMTGTADTESKEFDKIYGLGVTVIPTNRPVIRGDHDDLIFLTEKEKFEAICEEIERLHNQGQPMLVGTVSIEKSEHLAHLLTSRGIPHEILNAKNHAREALIIAEAGAQGAVTISTNMAGRGTDIKLGGNPEFRARRRVGSDADGATLMTAHEEERRKWESDYIKVKECGGLHVLGTERHEARRIDNQLRGRSGRQGDPGSSRFFISLDDSLMRLFGGENFKSLMSRIGMREGDPIMHPWINKSIERAQKKVEERNFEIRKHLLEYDDVLNEQRNFIYERRDSILADQDLKERVFASAVDLVTILFEEHRPEKPGDFGSVLSRLKEDFLYEPELSETQLESFSAEELREAVLRGLREELAEKERDLGSKNLNSFIRFEYLRNIDSRWQDHLESLEALREAVYLRAYAQKNPLLEYKLEGFQIFDQMLLDIRTEIAKKIFKVKIQPLEDRKLVIEKENLGQALHRVLGQFAHSPPREAQGERAEARPRSVQVTRGIPKVGRNDPCPCGSGKKYKFCHGR